MATVLDDIGADAIKTACWPMRASSAPSPTRCPTAPRRARSGDGRDLRRVLLDEAAIEAMRAIAAAARHAGHPQHAGGGEAHRPDRGNEAERIAPGAALLDMGAKAALVKGGHGGDDDADRFSWSPPRGGGGDHAAPAGQRHTHGTGCTMASAIATWLAQGMALEARCAGAGLSQAAIEPAPGFGAGHGPVNHLVRLGQW